MAEALSEIYGKPLPQRIPSLWESFTSAVEYYPDNTALIATHQPPNLFGITSQPLEDEQYRQKPYLRWNFKDFNTGIERTIRSLRSLGVHEEMPVMTFVNNSAEYYLVMQAANVIGAVLAPINPRNLANKDEITHMIKIIMSSCPGQRPVIVVQDSSVAKQIDALPVSEGAIKIVIQHETGTSISTNETLSNPKSWIPFEKVMAMSLGRHMTTGDSAHSSKDQTIFFTSGTTSLPKGCRKLPGRTTAFMEMRSFQRDVKPGDKWCIVVPNNHLMAYIMANASFNNGAGVVLAVSAPSYFIIGQLIFHEI
jgi:acyl-CoA synthetase (AMP-forming)/AMP-acid ligase II